MKNINLIPPSSNNKVRRKKPFIFVLIILLMLLGAGYFFLIMSREKQWILPLKDKFDMKIGPGAGMKKDNKIEKISIDQNNSKEDKTDYIHPEEQKINEGNNKIEEVKGGLLSKGIDAKINNKEMKKEESIIKDAKDAGKPGAAKEKKSPSKTDETFVNLGFYKENEIIQKGFSNEKMALSERSEKPALSKPVSNKEPEEDMKPAEVLKIASKSISKYYIQVCSCVIKGNADHTSQKLTNLGFSPKITEISRDIKMHNIYTGTFKDKANAFKLLNQLKAEGFDPVLIHSSGDRYKLRIASCFYLDNAQKLVKKLNRIGCKTNILNEVTSTRMYTVLLENFESLSEAEAIRQELMRNGYQSPVLKSKPLT